MKKEEIIQTFENFIKSNNNSIDKKYNMSKYKIKENTIDEILIEVRAGGSDGGNCWNDNPSIPYSQDREEIKSEIAEILTSKFSYLFYSIGNTKESLTTASSLLTNTIYDTPYRERHENEYYGNYTEHNLYVIKIEEMLETSLDADKLKLFKIALSNVKSVEDPIYLQNSLKDRGQELTKQLSTFDKEKAKEKSNIKTYLDRYQKSYDEFDGNVASIKEGLEKELKKVEKELNPVKPKKLKK